MFCPKCATQNTDDARFCRGCGADISLVPEVLTGALAERLAAVEDTRHGRRRRHRGEKPPSIEHAVRYFFLGLAFLFIAFAVKEWAPAGHIWWFWMFIPAAVNLASGVGGFARLASEGKRREVQGFNPPHTSALPPRHVSALPQRDTGEMVPPPSVTEGTTRHLGVPVERKRGEG
ncbi:MAG TPA: zinc ribbon domain-containing protein [Pyrinomonadaceae bacterium]